jgi:Na+/melibiose symporter-like transporter
MVSQQRASVAGVGRISRAGINLGYAFGNLGKSIVWTSFESFLHFYLVTFAGISPLSAGGLLAGAMFWDACADIVVGYFTDRNGRSDMLARLILIGAPLCGAAFWAVFALPARSHHLAIVLAVAVCRIGYTLCDIGHNTLLVRVSATPRNTSIVSGLRLMFSAAGAGLVGLASSVVLSAPALTERGAAFGPYALGGGIIYILTLIVAMRVTRLLPSMSPAPNTVRPYKLIKRLVHNRAYLRVLVVMAIQSSLVPLFARSLPFFGEIVHGDPAWAGVALSTMTLAQALSLPAWILLSRHQSSIGTMATAYALMIAGISLLLFNLGPSADLVPLIIIGVANAGINMAIWALLALSIRDGATDGDASEALPIGIFLATLKSASGVGGALFAIAVALQGWGCRSCIAGQSPVIISALVLPLCGCACCLTIIGRASGRSLPFSTPQ